MALTHYLFFKMCCRDMAAILLSWHIHWAQETSQGLNREPLSVTQNKKVEPSYLPFSIILCCPLFHTMVFIPVSEFQPAWWESSTCMMRVFKWKRDNLLINIINKIKKKFKCNLNNFSILISSKFISSNRYSSTFKINWRYKIYKPLELNPFRANWYLVLPYANSTILSLGRCLYHNNFSWAFLCAYLYDKGIVYIASLSLHNNIQGSSDFQRWGNCFKELA